MQRLVARGNAHPSGINYCKGEHMSVVRVVLVFETVSSCVAVGSCFRGSGLLH